MTAPASGQKGPKTYDFQHWELDGVQQGAGDRTVTFAIDEDITAIAVYERR